MRFLLTGIATAVCCLPQVALSASAAKSGLVLNPCEPEGIAPPVKCGTYTVWENRDTKTGRTIDLNLVVLAATGPDRQPDPVFLLSGGPGEAATNLAAELHQDPMRKQRDIVLVDLRGTGRSNGLFCGPPKDAPLQEFMAAFDPARAKVCRREFEQRADLRHYNNEASMDDLDELRAALGYERINVQGWSAGTVSSLVYLSRHGQHVRSVVLLGSAALTAAAPAGFAPDAEASLRTVLKDCIAEPACSKTFPAIEADYRKAVRRVREQGPVTTKVRDLRDDTQTVVKLDADAFAESLRAMLYDAEQTRRIPALLHRAADGDYREFAEYHLKRNVAFGHLIAMGLYYSMTCTEDVARVDRKAVIAEGTGTFFADARARPHFAVCDVWPRGRLSPVFNQEVKSDAPVLIVNGEIDPATPPAGARSAASRMSNARVIIVPQAGHNMNGLTDADCATAIVNRFVETADQKSLDTSCVAKIRRNPFILHERTRMRTTLSPASPPPSQSPR